MKKPKKCRRWVWFENNEPDCDCESQNAMMDDAEKNKTGHTYDGNSGPVLCDITPVIPRKPKGKRAKG